MNRISHWIDGTVSEGSSGRSGGGVQPGGRRAVRGGRPGLVGRGRGRRRCGRGCVSRLAINALAARAEVLFRLRELLDAHRKELASLITAEHGKVLSDALGEVARGLENVEFACGVPHLLKGGYSEQVSAGVDVYSVRQPLGVVAGITPFNFPVMVPMWMFANAIGAATPSS